MANIELSKLELLQDELDFLQDGDFVFLTENGEKQYAVVPMEMFRVLEELETMFDDTLASPVVKVNSENLDLSYDEYERIKEQIMEAVEKTLMPKPEKLN